VQAQCQADGLQADLQHWAAQLELHMFKEEMRLFPMMEQGGNTLIPRLIDDLQREHFAHGHALQAMLQRLDAMPPSCQAAPAWQALRSGLQAFEAALQAHIALEDGTLFPMFLPLVTGSRPVQL
jgi:regulator of cell morphogenesis and NO signaling